jgi:hypothetical protein
MLAKQAAEGLRLGFHALSLGQTTPRSKVFGYYDAHGNYHGTPFRRAFEEGGAMLLDELDNGHPGLLGELNQALALRVCAFELVLDDDAVARRKVGAYEVERGVPDRVLGPFEFQFHAEGLGQGVGVVQQPGGEVVGLVLPDFAQIDRFEAGDAGIAVHRSRLDLPAVLDH